MSLFYASKPPAMEPSVQSGWNYTERKYDLSIRSLHYARYGRNDRGYEEILTRSALEQFDTGFFSHDRCECSVRKSWL